MRSGISKCGILFFCIFQSLELRLLSAASGLGFDPSKDYYQILGVTKEEDLESIRISYRKIALENHPDRNPDNPQALEYFKEAAEAWGVISDADKRRLYDIERARLTGDIVYRGSTAEQTEEESLQEELLLLMRGISVDQILTSDAPYVLKMKAYGELLLEHKLLKRAFFRWAEYGLENNDRSYFSGALQTRLKSFASLLHEATLFWVAENYQPMARAYLAKSVFQYDLFVRKFRGSMSRKRDRKQWSHIENISAEEVALAEVSQTFRLGFLFRNQDVLTQEFRSLFKERPRLWLEALDEFKFYLQQSNWNMDADALSSLDSLRARLKTAPPESRWSRFSKTCAARMSSLLQRMRQLRE